MDKRFAITLGVIIIGFIGLVAYSKMSASPEVESTGSNNIFGKLDSKVTLTEFVDFQCEACYGFYPTVKEIKEKYKDRVKFQVKYFPITSGHANALAAAATAQAAAKQDKFWEMHNLLFERQKSWENNSPTTRDEVFAQYAEEIGLDMDKFRVDIASDETQSVIKADLAEVKRLGGDGTPTFALNGKKIANPKNTVDAISKVLDDELAKANQN